MTREGGHRAARSRALYWDHHADGVYTCVCCGEPLFDSETKFESGTGWPSFFAAGRAGENVEDRTDTSHGMVAHRGRLPRAAAPTSATSSRTARRPTGLRYCINSASLDFEGREEG